MPSNQRANTRPASKQDRRARVEAMRAQERARERRQRLLIIGGGAGFAALIILIVVIAVATKGGGSKSSASKEALPPSVGSGSPHVEAPALVVKDTSGIPGVVAYDTSGYPGTTGPVSKALPHNHLEGPIRYSVTPPVGGDHNGLWMNCGVYTSPVPTERAVHNLEHGAIWITYQPTLPQSEIDQLKAFVEKQSKVVLHAGSQSQKTGQRYMDLTPFPGLDSPIAISAWGYQLKVTSPTDPRLQKFVDTFRVNPKYSPEYGSACNNGVGTPAAT